MRASTSVLLRAALAAACALVMAGAAAQGAAKAEPLFDINGPTLDGAPWRLAQARGKVLMVFYFNTACVPCLQKMPELRANAAGWRNKPFELLLVSTDPKREDALAYTLAVRQVEPSAVRFTTLWAGDSQFRDTLPERPKKLPLTLVLDAQGKQRARYEGRIAPEAWDDVAELLP